MKRKLYVILIAIIVTAALLLVPNGVEKIKYYTKEEHIDAKINYQDSDKKSEAINVDTPNVSGVVSNLPWANNDKFLEAQKENNTNVLMAAYCAVLDDPLPGEEFNVQLAASFIKGTVLEPNQVFSQNKKAGPYLKSKGYKAGPTYIGSKLATTVGGGVCKIASTLYNVSVLSNLQIVERYNHSMPVPYVPNGQDATVCYGAKDFKFRNNTDSPVLIWAEGIENRLYIALYGKEEPPKVEWNHEVLSTTKAPKYYKNSPSLKKGEEKVILEGVEGASVKSWVKITKPDGTTKTKNLGISYYKPMPYIIQRNK
ncbi:VanW family protein [Clostridium cylindrosporum]|uniref:VanW family protein n=1 Tax=Clostridium cylindrosporum DSM 605 TaxID=1121307 RepID=A0A0J8D8F2_CLOCY|nr:VanW family protein [Clostridium cylindrosporum]KMT22152.1 VanW family protein [Clostridium cylindrosporum DSM 605]